ncbi:hypothetical protein ACFQ05_32545 [Amycolatopsis umgeniensis]|uniref:ABC-type multidrug transport system fused ATPase/permease subunit n=1 Tax=Amycolatopsis umgeniensis TaxID=336628 RepID=A0A841AVV5_9PSEU|nr:hypothetical protein [Amycolatopsis umgeniensis]MBB5850515.1 ABC-type multidrug transport system fused ATPase/permease subunit [Amycolatopsis umgeniensis]
MVNQLGEALVPVLAELAVDRAVTTDDVADLCWWIALLALDFLVLAVAYRAGSRIGRLGMESVQLRLRGLVTARVLRPVGMGGPARPAGDLLSVATSDVARVARAVAIGVYPAGGDCPADAAWPRAPGENAGRRRPARARWSRHRIARPSVVKGR